MNLGKLMPPPASHPKQPSDTKQQDNNLEQFNNYFSAANQQIPIDSKASNLASPPNAKDLQNQRYQKHNHAQINPNTALENNAETNSGSLMDIRGYPQFVVEDALASSNHIAAESKSIHKVKPQQTRPRVTFREDLLLTKAIAMNGLFNQYRLYNWDRVYSRYKKLLKSQPNIQRLYDRYRIYIKSHFKALSILLIDIESKIAPIEQIQAEILEELGNKLRPYIKLNTD